MELLIVIAILAVLAMVTVVVINPAELMGRGRDAQRIGDLSSLKTALMFYIAEAATPDLDGTAAGRPVCGTALTNVFISSAAPGGGTLAAGATSTTPGLITGAGWVPVNLSVELAAIGSPLAAWPIDPTNIGPVPARRFYTYACRVSPLGFHLIANLEAAGNAARERDDGGNHTALFETGTVVTLISTADLGTLYGTP